jgi:hypothetical protein
VGVGVQCGCRWFQCGCRCSNVGVGVQCGCRGSNVGRVEIGWNVKGFQILMGGVCF